MIIDHASPSSITTFRSCQWMYYLRYILHAEQMSGKAAVEGKIVHGTLEAVARARTANGIVEVDEALSSVWDREVAAEPGVKLRRETSHGTSADYLRIQAMINQVLVDPKFSPLHSHIVDVEQSFELVFDSPEWQVTTPEGAKQGFVVRGIMDLVREINDTTIEVIDWKTGKREDFWSPVPGVKKSIADLMGDVQLRIYHLAATQVYNQYPNVLLTIYFIKDGGPFTIPFSAEDIPSTVEYLWKFMKQVQGTTIINRTRSWRCRRLCSYGRNGLCDALWGEMMANLHDPNHLPQNYANLTIEGQRQLLNFAQEVTDDEVKDA